MQYFVICTCDIRLCWNPCWYLSSFMNMNIIDEQKWFWQSMTWCWGSSQVVHNCYWSEAMHHHLKWSSDKLCKYRPTDVHFLTLNVNQTLSYICGILVNWQGLISSQVQSCRFCGWGLMKLTATKDWDRVNIHYHIRACERCGLGGIYWSNIWLFVNDIWIVQADTVVNSDNI